MDNNLTQADGMYAIDQFYHQSTSLVFAKKRFEHFDMI